MEQPVDYLVLGSGLAALSFSALMAKQHKRVKILEAHEHLGGYGHNFSVGDYSFNAQLHYVSGCGEGGIVHQFLKKINLENQISFNKFSNEGYDRVYCDGKELWIPYGYDNLKKNMEKIAPESVKAIERFINILKRFEKVVDHLPKTIFDLPQTVLHCFDYVHLWKYRSSSLQNVFDECQLPKILQTLVAGQLIDYMLPPKDLSFFIWLALFNSYNKGAFYPVNHFDHVIDCLVDSIKNNGGEICSSQRVVGFIREKKEIQGVYTQEVNPKTGIHDGPKNVHYGKSVICNFDPQIAAEMIDRSHFSWRVRRALRYDYSYSSFVLYGVVKDLDLSQYGFGPWNIWHCQPDHNQSFKAMYDDCDYRKPYFAANCRSLHTESRKNCQREGCQIFQICTVANYEYWKSLKMNTPKEYNLKKTEVLNHLLNAVEQYYVPKIREHLVLKMTGTPTTNERFVLTPKGGSYGVNLTPRNFQLSRKLTSHTSFKNFYFCSAASGFGGFIGTILTGTKLYEKLTGDSVR